jgi:solute carrier family 50 protein (sugar transporter)
MEKVQEIFGWVATGLTMCFYISPVIPFINVFRGKLSYEDTPAIIVSTSYVNCFCWYIYGDMIFSDQIKICNLIGAISSLVLMCIYLGFEVRKYTIDAILNALIIITGSYAVYRGLTIIIDDDAIIGKICNGTALIVFLSPIQLIYRVIKEKNYNLIPIYTAWVSLASTGCWVIYGVFLSDFYVIFPNVIGIVLAITQIFVFLNYKRKYPSIGHTTSTIGIENTGNEEIKKEEDTVIKEDEENQKNVKEKPVKIVAKVDN